MSDSDSASDRDERKSLAATPSGRNSGTTPSGRKSTSLAGSRGPTPADAAQQQQQQSAQKGASSSKDPQSGRASAPPRNDPPATLFRLEAAFAHAFEKRLVAQTSKRDQQASTSQRLDMAHAGPTLSETQARNLLRALRFTMLAILPNIGPHTATERSRNHPQPFDATLAEWASAKRTRAELVPRPVLSAQDADDLDNDPATNAATGMTMPQLYVSRDLGLEPELLTMKTTAASPGVPEQPEDELVARSDDAGGGHALVWHLRGQVPAHHGMRGGQRHSDGYFDVMKNVVVTAVAAGSGPPVYVFEAPVSTAYVRWAQPELPGS
jgi:hypothetical protein